MSNQGKITSASALNTVIFKEHANSAAGRKFFSLFPGLGYAAGYKVRRTCKYSVFGFGVDVVGKTDLATDLQIWWPAVCA